MARRGWSRSLSGFVRQVERDLTERMQEIVLDAFGMIIRLSPVDTGAFRGNNRLSIGAPSDSYDLSATGTENERQAQATMQALRVPFTVAYITNNLPYAEKLESGSSQQAPAGVYAVAANSLREKYGR